MNTKIPVKKLAETIAETSGVSIDESLQFIKSLFSTIVDELASGESVTIDGLGKFSLSDNPDEPVVFIPMSDFADDINAPFAMFEPTVLNDGVDIDELNRIDTCQDATTSEPIAEDQTEVVLAPVEVENEIPSPTPVVVEVKSEEIISLDNSVETSPVETTAEQSAFNENEPQSEQMPIQPESVRTDIVELTSDDVAEPVGNGGSDKTSDTVAETTSLDIPEDEEEFVPATDNAQKSQFGLGFVLGLILGLIIGALALFAYMVYFINTPTPIP